MTRNKTVLSFFAYSAVPSFYFAFQACEYLILTHPSTDNYLIKVWLFKGETNNALHFGFSHNMERKNI